MKLTVNFLKEMVSDLKNQSNDRIDNCEYKESLDWEEGYQAALADISEEIDEKVRNQ